MALVGRNGAGKTTTLRSVMGFTDVVAGRIAFDGRDLARCLFVCMRWVELLIWCVWGGKAWISAPLGVVFAVSVGM